MSHDAEPMRTGRPPAGDDRRSDARAGLHADAPAGDAPAGGALVGVDAGAPGAATPLPLDSLAGVGAALAARPYVARGVAVSGDTIRVVLADDHTVLRAGVRALLRGAPDLQVVGEAADGPEAVRVARYQGAHVVVMDLDMPGGGGAEAIAELAALAPALRVLILTMHAEEESLIALLRAGAHGYLMKDAAERELVDAIRAVAAGEVYVRPRVARMLAGAVRPPAPASPEEARLQARRAEFAALSDREQTVVRLTAAGYNGPEIGGQLGISAKTVDTYKQRVEEKLGLRHRTEYVQFAVDLGLLGRR